MKKKICPLEKEVMESLKKGALEPELQNHVSQCPVCKDVVAVHTWMKQFKEKAWETDRLKKDLPDAESMWNRAHAWKGADRQMVRKALKPLIFPQVLSFVVFIAGGIFLGFKGILKLGNIFDSPALTRVFPFFLILISMVLFSAIFCVFLLALEKRKKPI